MGSVIDYYNSLLHKPFAAITLLDAGAIAAVILVIAFGISAFFTLLARK